MYVIINSSYSKPMTVSERHLKKLLLIKRNVTKGEELINLAQGFCEHGAEHSGSIKFVAFLYCLRNHLLVKKGSVQIGKFSSSDLQNGVSK
jgi:hypothetical protein